MQKSFGIEPLLSRCLAAVKPSSTSPPLPLRASSKVRDSPRSIPLASIPQEEEEALERELETWIWTQQQMMLQRPSTPQLQQVRSSGSVNSTISSSPLASHVLSLPLPSKTRRSQLNINNITNNIANSINNNEKSLPRQHSQPSSQGYGKTPRDVSTSMMDSDPTDRDLAWPDHKVSLRVLYLNHYPDRYYYHSI